MLRVTIWICPFFCVSAATDVCLVVLRSGGGACLRNEAYQTRSWVLVSLVRGWSWSRASVRQVVCDSLSSHEVGTMGSLEPQVRL